MADHLRLILLCLAALGIHAGTVKDKWTLVSSICWKHVTIGNGGVYVLKTNGDLYTVCGAHRDNLHYEECFWRVGSSKFKQVSAGRDILWAVNNQNHVYINIDEWGKPTSKEWPEWEQITGQAMSHVSVSVNNHVWAISPNGNIYRRIGITFPCRFGSSWRQIAGTLMQISVGGSGVWGVNSTFGIYYRQGTYGDVDTDGSGWTHVPGALHYITSYNGGVYGTAVHTSIPDEVYFRTGMTKLNPTGLSWLKIDGSMVQVDAFDGALWGVSDTYSLYARSSDPPNYRRRTGGQ